MKHFKLLFASLALFGAVSANAQTDVTANFLTNADFSESTPIEENLYGYGKDMASGSVYGIQDVDGWQYTILSGDNSNTAYPNSGMGGGVFAYGSSNQLKGNNVTAPAAGPDGNAGNGLAFFAVWGCGAYYYQDVTFPSGEYTITIPVYCVSGTQSNTSYIGFMPNSGSSYTVATNPAVGQWTTQTISFTLAAETAGKIVLGYKSTGSGSGLNPHLFFDKVTIMYTSTVIKDDLAAAIETATSANEKLNNSELAAAIADAQAVYDNPTASQDEVNAQVEALRQAISAATAAYVQETGDATILITNPGFELSTPETTNWAASATPNSADYASTGWTNSQAAGWSSSAIVAYGGEGQVNGVNAPAADNEGNPGNALGISVGWSGKVTYKSNTILLTPGAYTMTVNAYNNLSGVTQFISQNGFIPTNGSSYLSNKTSFTYGEWTTDVITFILDEDTEGYIQLGGQAYNAGSGNNAKVFFDNITLTYSDPLEAVKAAYEEALAAAQDAAADPDYSNVSGEERDALDAEIAKAEPTTKEGYEEATAALQEATATFTAAKASYDNLEDVKGMVWALELPYADQTKKPSTDDVVATSAADADAQAQALLVALRPYYESNAAAEAVEGAVDMRSYILNNDATDGNNNWTTTGNMNQPRNTESWTDADGNNTYMYFDGGNWGGTGWTTTMEQAITVPAGQYLLTAKGRASDGVTLTMSVGEESVALPNVNASGNVFDRGWNDGYVVFETDGDAVTIKITATTAGNHQWFSVGDFRLVQLEAIEVPMADDDDYAALQEAVSPYLDLLLGFDEGEYAPYTNVEAALLAEEIASLDPEKVANHEYTKEYIQGLTAAVQALTVTPNETELNAVYDGDFALQPAHESGDNVVLPGWTTVSGNTRLILKDTEAYPALTDADAQSALFVHPGTYEYGHTTGYTMPLDGGAVYELTFKYSAWQNGSNNNFTATIKNEVGETIASEAFGRVEGGLNTAGSLKAVKMYFTPAVDGNYILSLNANGNSAFTDVKIVKAVVTDLVLSNTDTEAPAEQYAGTVTTDRTLLEGLNTIVLPFETTNEEIGAATVLEYTGTTTEEDGTITLNFKEVTTLKANVPYAVMLTEEEGENAQPLAFENKEVAPAGDLTVADANFSFVGTYADFGKNNDIVQNGDYIAGAVKFKKATGGNRVAAYRAYMKKAEGTPEGAKIAFNFGGTIVDGIEAVEILNNLSGDIFNLNGQKLQKAQKGINIINGKKVLVK